MASDTETLLDVADIIRDHAWNDLIAGCACGWSQRDSLGRWHARTNHPVHVADKLRDYVRTPGGQA